ncbi:MAG TPA: hypothetical protein PKZ84_21410 [Anaerolineae bacterium]|nr:hypothetical protein [Anaerolineae bacterium]HQI87154.1 hypothetical protein [Anaerolineae bacterium]
MAEQLTIITSNRSQLKPLVTSALERQKRLLALGIARTHARLTAFEKTYKMSSEEFERRLYTLELTETVDFTDWRMEIETLRLLEGQRRTLEEARLD